MAHAHRTMDDDREARPIAISSLVAGIALMVFVPSSGQTQDFWSFLPANATISRCVEGSQAHERAARGISELDAAIEALALSESPRQPVDSLYALLQTECFWMASESPRLPRPDSSQSLKEWWHAGGADWLAGYLELPMLGPVEALRPHIPLPPDIRKTLTAETSPEHPLRRFLCPAGDRTCGIETQGWTLRADTALEAHRALGKHDNEPRQVPTDRLAQGRETSEECDTRQRARPSADDYSRWRACLEARRVEGCAGPPPRERDIASRGRAQLLNNLAADRVDELMAEFRMAATRVVLLE